jgi:hypothetical protein
MVENETDTVAVKFSFSDSLQRTGLIDHPWQKGGKYQLMIPDSIFIDIAGASHDTVIYNFKILSDEDYGKLILDVVDSTAGEQYIIQLLTDKRVLLKEFSVNGSKTLEFGYLTPGSYIFKAIVDENKNGKWDPGDYLMKKQPEKIFFNPQVYQVRANWEVRESWVVP